MFSNKLYVFFTLRLLNVTACFSPPQTWLPSNWKDGADNHCSVGGAASAAKRRSLRLCPSEKLTSGLDGFGSGLAPRVLGREGLRHLKSTRVRGINGHRQGEYH
jgi:hypothetical protein